LGKRVGPAADRVAARSVAGPGGCFLWTGGRNDGGYGVIQTNKVQQYVHRVAYEAWVGPTGCCPRLTPLLTLSQQRPSPVPAR
jgi:hypothetical protein